MNFVNKNICFTLLATLLITACEKPAPQALPPQGVNIVIAIPEDLPLKFEYPAQLVSDYDVVIKPQVNGVIMEKYFKAGDYVKKGDKLFLIEPYKYKAAVDAAWGKALQARADFDNAEKDHERNKILIAKNAISQKDFDTSLATYKSTKATLESARADVSNAKIDLDYTEIKAPFDGMVGDALINVGDYVIASSTDLVRVTNLNPIYADFYISDTNKLNIERNLQNGRWDLQNYKVSFKTAEREYEGELYFIDSVIDLKSGSVKAKAVFDNSNSVLLPGTFVTLASDGFIQKGGFKIPRIALMQDQKENYLYTISEESTVKKNVVKVSYQTSDYVIIESGINEGDKVIIDNFKKIGAGSPVRELGAQEENIQAHIASEIASENNETN
ncbi:efflux RND transporter periplasmic adaptor subunit [Campylobacter sp. LR291e]|nr:efflux RND transporter periplasmic adaptor subunit [Campylobacter sp. LR185c]KAA6227497.1 efflux RND transporter periplasmic adaptor subunit [Campylobacter sp. LR196d]KAA6230914.1 efflux RND transporter periplasmic adaptor subunit [Campylobacter sp. LR291e]KAA6233548.1 efflux RND transporter periplasmic adaptor subunit [Campylobacter sp. LR264d]KAA8603833.1 efflux transporter periplasmic adaptor subunit [Campylobacter sp. LR185c]